MFALRRGFEPAECVVAKVQVGKDWIYQGVKKYLSEWSGTSKAAEVLEVRLEVEFCSSINERRREGAIG